MYCSDVIVELNPTREGALNGVSLTIAAIKVSKQLRQLQYSLHAAHNERARERETLVTLRVVIYVTSSTVIASYRCDVRYSCLCLKDGLLLALLKSIIRLVVKGQKNL